jgi:hypothetical protein
MCIEKYLEVSIINNFMLVRVSFSLFSWRPLLFTNYIATVTDMCQEFPYAVSLILPDHINIKTLLWRG